MLTKEKITMKSNLNKNTQTKKCVKTNKWLIITTIFTVSILTTSCVPPINQTTGERTSKKELYKMSNHTTHNRSKKYRNQQQNQSNVNFANERNNSREMNDSNFENGELDAIQEFEKKLNQKSNNSRRNQPQNSTEKPLPTLKEQIEKLNENQLEMEENILNIKGELLEIKGILSDMDRARFSSPTTGRGNTQSTNNNNANSSVSNSSQFINSEENEPVRNQTFLIDSDEETANSNNETVNSTVKTVAPKVQTPQKKVEAKPQTNNRTATNNNSNRSSDNNSKPPANSNNKTTMNNNSNVAENNTQTNNQERDFSEIINRVAKGEYATAIKLINDKLRTTKDPEVIASCNYWLGECSFRQKDYAKSIPYFKIVLDSASDKRDVAQSRIAESYLRVGNNEEAKAAYQNLLRDFPRSTYSPRAKRMLQQL